MNLADDSSHLFLLFCSSGSALSIGSNVSALFKQLGIYDEFTEAGKDSAAIRMHDDKGNLLSITDFTEGIELYELIFFVLVGQNLLPTESLSLVANLLSPIPYSFNL